MSTDFYNISATTVATLTWETLDISWEVLQGKVTRGCTKTDALSLSGCTSLIFVNPGTKIDGCYYRDVVLMQQMLPSIHSISGDAYVFQQDSSTVHCAHQTVELLQHETPKFITPDLWPLNSPDLNPVDYRIWDVTQDCVYQTPDQDVTDLKLHLTDAWNGLSQSIIDDAEFVLLTTNGEGDLGHMWRKRKTFWTFAVG